VKKIINTIWNYLRPSWEDELNQFSYKRASQYAFLILMSFMVISDRIRDEFTFNAFLVLSILFALTAMVITVPQLIKLLKNYVDAKSFKQKNNETIIPTDTPDNPKPE
jgi:hypothetical protein